MDDITSNTIFREIVEEDFPAVASFYEKLDSHLRGLAHNYPKEENIGELYLDSYARTLGRFTVIYVAEYQGRPVGFILARLKRAPKYYGGVVVGELQDIWVEPEVRRSSIGITLIRMAIAWLREQDVYSIDAQILLDNIPSQKMVEQLGLKKVLYQYRLNWEDYIEG